MKYFKQLMAKHNLKCKDFEGGILSSVYTDGHISVMHKDSNHMKKYIVSVDNFTYLEVASLEQLETLLEMLK